jgi:hypothetical protein
MQSSFCSQQLVTNKQLTSSDGVEMKRSTALTFQMIKTSNRLRAMRALGIGAGVLGAGALGALGLQYLPGAEGAMAGGPGMTDGAFGAVRATKPLAGALSDAYGVTDSIDRPSSLASRAFGAINNAKEEAMYSPVPSAAAALRDNASMGMFNTPTDSESFQDFAPSMSDRIFGLGRAGADAAGRLGSMMDISGDAPSMSDRIFGLGRAGAGAAGRLNNMMDISGSPPSMSDSIFGLGRAGADAAGRLGSMMDISGSPPSMSDRIFSLGRAGAGAARRLNNIMDISGSPPSMSDRVFSLGRAAGPVAGAYTDAASLMEPSEVGEWSPSTWQGIGDYQTMNRALARSIPRMPADFATRGGGAAGLMSSVPAY